MQPPPGIGNNQPPLSTALSDDTEDLRKEIDVFAARASAAPRHVKNDADLSAAGALVTDAKDLGNRIDLKRKMIKDPYLRAGKEVDSFFKPLSERILKVVDVFQALSNAYMREKVAKERAEAEAAARKLREEQAAREEAARKAEEANRSKTAATHTAKAEEAATKAEEAEARAQAPIEDIAKTTTDTGVTISGKAEWVADIDNYDAIDLNPLKPYLPRDAVEKALKMAVKMGLRSAAGVRTHQEVKAKFR